MKNFISCDWGTSSFRLRLTDTNSQTVLAEIKTSQGIAATYALWKHSGLDRFTFYFSILSGNVKLLEKDCGYCLDNFTIVISGMASSGIGMMELNYKELPLKANGADLLVNIIEPSDHCKYRMIIISGIRSATDVLRGEETILAGCNTDNDQEAFYIFPGTHCKQVIVNNGIVTSFKTYMTGEFFDLLSTKSILSSSVVRDDNNFNNESSFEKGVKEGISNNLLHSSFMVRTNHLFSKLTSWQNYHYLGGLLIGAELKELLSVNYKTVTLVSAGILMSKYSHALTIIGINKNVEYINADQALIKGQCIIYQRYN